jgi:AcrR family transcriptional regulator
MPKKSKTAEPGDLKEACIQVARDFIAEHGIENLSLRDVARRLGVSHQAPYRHYPNRDHLLAEVLRRCFQGFAAHLDARDRFDDPKADLQSMGRQYLSYAAQHPLEYRLMFDTPWPQAAEHPSLLQDARHAFDLLLGVLRRIHGTEPAKQALIELDALYIWSSMHGIVGIMQCKLTDRLELSPQVPDQAALHVMQMILKAMDGPR